MRRTAVGLIVIISACTTLPFAVHFPEGAYGQIVQKNTRSRAIYHGFDAICFLVVTNETKGFLKARANKLGRTYRIPGAEAALRSGDIPPVEAAAQHEFFLALNTASRWANNMDSPTSQWGAALMTPSGIVQPEEILRVSIKPVEVQAYFPYFDNFFVAYRILFPESIGDGPYTLILSNPRGEARLSFEAPRAVSPGHDATPR